MGVVAAIEGDREAENGRFAGFTGETKIDETFAANVRGTNPVKNGANHPPGGMIYVGRGRLTPPGTCG